jgi:hypothetical protein
MPLFAPFQSYFSGILPQLPSVIQIGFAWLPRLSDRQRQSLHPSQHASRQVSREMDLRQQSRSSSCPKQETQFEGNEHVRMSKVLVETNATGCLH